MKFTYGCSRWIILTKNYAIKIARIRPIHPFIRFFELRRNKEEITEKFDRYHKNRLVAIAKYLLHGVLANKTEYRLYKKVEEKEASAWLAPTLYSFYGLVNVQVRGNPASEKRCEHTRNPLWNTHPEIGLAKQYCIINERVRLADYGDDETEDILIELSV